MILKPLTPFEPVTADKIPEGEQWISQIKWDGVRVLTYYDGESARLFNRKLHERTAHYPELTDMKKYCNADSVILDGEVIALGDDGKPSFQQVMRRDGIKKMDRARDAMKEIPISYMVFDVLYYNQQWTHQWSLKERLELLKEIILPNDRIHIVPSVSEGHALFEAIKEQEMEGIIVKNINSRYQINGKDDRWRKIKNYRYINAVIGGVTLRDGVINALLLGARDDKGQLWYIGRAGTGKLKKSDWRELTNEIKPLIAEDRPFFNKTDREKEAVWIQPKLAVSVRFMEWTKRLTLRQPSIQSFIDIDPKDCKLTIEFPTVT